MELTNYKSNISNSLSAAMPPKKPIVIDITDSSDEQRTPAPAPRSRPALAQPQEIIRLDLLSDSEDSAAAAEPVSESDDGDLPPLAPVRRQPLPARRQLYALDSEDEDYVPPPSSPRDISLRGKCRDDLTFSGAGKYWSPRKIKTTFSPFHVPKIVPPSPPSSSEEPESVFSPPSSPRERSVPTTPRANYEESNSAATVHYSDDFSLSSPPLHFMPLLLSPAAKSHFPLELSALDPVEDNNEIDYMNIDPAPVIDPLVPLFHNPRLDTEDRAWIDQLSPRKEPAATVVSQPTQTFFEALFPKLTAITEPEPIVVGPSSAVSMMAALDPFLPELSLPLIETPILSLSTALAVPPPPTNPEPEPAKVSKVNEDQQQQEKPRGAPLDTDTKRKKRIHRDTTGLKDKFSAFFTPADEKRQRKPAKH